MEGRKNGENFSKLNVSVPELEVLTGYNFSGMKCCAGTSVIHIDPDGTARGLICGLVKDKYNIYKENPFREDGMIRLIYCTRDKCTCKVNYRTPKFLDWKAAETFITSCRRKQQQLLSEYNASHENES